jgi:uncharacterized integral membrane protein (TIGR00697 family)
MGVKTVKHYRHIDSLTALTVAVLIISNLASSAKIVGFTLFGFWGMPPVRLAFDGGTLLFPAAYVLGDILTEVYGFRAARRVIWTGFIALALSSLFFFILALLPADASWEEYAGASAYRAILGGMSTGGITAASLAGYLTGEFANSAIHSRLKILMKGRALWVRTLGSSLAGEFFDTLVFVSVASFMGVFGRGLFATLVLTNCLIKVSIEAVIFPLTFFAVRKLKQAEGIDTFDLGVKLNPFALR